LVLFELTLFNVVSGSVLVRSCNQKARPVLESAS